MVPGPDAKYWFVKVHHPPLPHHMSWISEGDFSFSIRSIGVGSECWSKCLRSECPRSTETSLPHHGTKIVALEEGRYGNPGADQYGQPANLFSAAQYHSWEDTCIYNSPSPKSSPGVEGPDKKLNLVPPLNADPSPDPTTDTTEVGICNSHRSDKSSPR